MVQTSSSDSTGYTGSSNIVYAILGVWLNKNFKHRRMLAISTTY